jgi:hypothetical protein
MAIPTMVVSLGSAYTFIAPRGQARGSLTSSCGSSGGTTHLQVDVAGITDTVWGKGVFSGPEDP